MILSLMSFVMMNVPSHAALPPYYNRVTQMNAVLDSAEVSKELTEASPIARIGHLGFDADGMPEFSVETQEGCAVSVNLAIVTADPNQPPAPGPARYKVAKVSGRICTAEPLWPAALTYAERVNQLKIVLQSTEVSKVLGVESAIGLLSAEEDGSYGVFNQAGCHVLATLSATNEIDSVSKKSCAVKAQ